MIPVRSEVEWITGTELVELYGVCETCGGPRSVAEVEFADGTELSMLICVANAMIHPA